MTDVSPEPLVQAATSPDAAEAMTGYRLGVLEGSSTVGLLKTDGPLARARICITADFRVPSRISSHASTRPSATAAICGCVGFGPPRVGMRWRAVNVRPS